jgi:hypothetical protein
LSAARVSLRSRLSEMRRWNCGSETYNRRIHQDAKVVAQVGTGEAQGIHASQDEEVAEQEQRDAGIFDEGLEEQRVRRLVHETLVVQVVSDYADGEDRNG